MSGAQLTQAGRQFATIELLVGAAALLVGAGKLGFSIYHVIEAYKKPEAPKGYGGPMEDAKTYAEAVLWWDLVSAVLITFCIGLPLVIGGGRGLGFFKR